MSAEDSATRSSSGSGGRSSSGRSRQNPQQQLSTIEKSVTHLLVATKQLLETLTMWSRGTATEAEVSDVYVRLGYEFNIACRAFNGIGVETNDLGPVPDLLRSILEETLSQEASQASLDRFLPRIRDIIINLLHGLKKKQQRLRQRTGRETGSTGGSSRQASIASSEVGIPPGPEDAPSRQSSSRSFAQRQGSGETNGPDLPPRTTSVQGGRSSPRRDNFSPNSSIHRPREASRDTHDSGSSMSSNAMQNMSVIAPYPSEDLMPDNPPQPPPTSTYNDLPLPPPPPPPPPPKQQDALAALQRGGELERRASRRFSAYQIQKHLGTPTGVPMIPPAQNSPIPNRGRGDAQESMRAVRTRSTLLHSRTKSGQKAAAESSPRRNEAPKRPDRPEELEAPARLLKPEEDADSPMMKTPEDKLGAYPFPSVESRQEEALGPTVNGPIIEPVALAEEDRDVPHRRKSALPSRYNSRQHAHRSPPQQQEEFVPETSPQPGKELTLFLQYKSKIKKFVLPDGDDLSLGRLQLAFIEKFAWNTHNNGVDLPEIYIQDPVSGVRHEVEDLADIKDRSVLVLNVEALDEVKRHFDDGLGGLRQLMEGIHTAVTDQQSALQAVSDRQQEAAKEIATLATRAPTAPVIQSHVRTTSSAKETGTQLGVIQTLRRDLAVMRQTYTSFVADVNASMSSIRTKAASVRTAADKARVPSMSANSGRAYVNNGKKNLSDDSEKLVTSVDDLQDTVEDLRKDVVTRGVRPLPRQLETVSKDISAATTQLKKMQEFLKREKPIWTKIWEKELQVVCDDRDLLTMQEELCVDLEDDLEKAATTFALVEQATKQQNLHNPTGQRSTSRTLNPVGADPQKAKDGVLGEVRALQPNHENRLEAIERAERVRQKELEDRRGGEFQKELGSFVEEGKLKKSGGVEEAERLRKMKDERNRREVWERQNARARAAEERAAEKSLPPPPPAEDEGRNKWGLNGEGMNGEAPAQNGEQDKAPPGLGGDDAADAHTRPDALHTNGISEPATHEDGAPVPSYKLELPPGSFPEGGSTGPPSPDPEFVEAKEQPPTPAAE